jgi:hypothetical protein
MISVSAAGATAAAYSLGLFTRKRRAPGGEAYRRAQARAGPRHGPGDDAIDVTDGHYDGGDVMLLKLVASESPALTQCPGPGQPG